MNRRLESSAILKATGASIFKSPRRPRANAGSRTTGEELALAANL